MSNMLKNANVSFRCTPADKIKLIESAKERGLTLSEYVNTFISNLLSEQPANMSSFEDSERLKKYENEAKSRLISNGKLIDGLSEKVRVYESMPAAKALFSKMDGQQVCFYTQEKKRVTGKVENIQDIFTIVQSLIKNE